MELAVRTHTLRHQVLELGLSARQRFEICNFQWKQALGFAKNALDLRCRPNRQVATRHAKSGGARP